MPSEERASWHSKVTAVQQAKVEHGIEVHALIKHASVHVLQAILRSATAEHGQDRPLPQHSAAAATRHAVLA